MVTREVVEKALKDSKKGSSPSHTGITYKHIQLMFDANPDFVVAMFNQSLNED